MVATRGKRKTASYIKTTEENKTADSSSAQVESSDPVTVNLEECKADAQFEPNSEEVTTVEECKADAQLNENSDSQKVNVEGLEFKDKEEINIEPAGHEECQDTGVKGEDGKVKVDNGDENTDNMAQSEQNSSEDDEVDDQEDLLWEDDEENSDEDDEENLFGEDDLNGEDVAEEDDDEDDDSEEGATEEDDKHEDDKEEATKKGDEGNIKEEKKITEGDGREANEHNNDKVEVGLKNITKSGENSRKVTARAEKLKKLEAKDKPEPSTKRKAKEKVQSMGMIFMCSSETKSDCYKYKVLGLPESKKDIVEKIYKGMRLFLYDVDLKLMYGIYKAATPGGYKIEQKAFKSQFPAQVRFTVMEDCLPLAEEKFKKVIKENYFTKNKFDCLLNSAQVGKLCKLFIASSKAQRRKRLARSRKAEKTNPIRQETSRRQTVENKRRLASREEPGYRDRRNKRPRKVISPAAPLLQPLPSSGPSYVYERPLDVDAYRRDPYIESRGTLRDERDPYLIRRDPYRDALYPTPERRDYDRDGRYVYLERASLYRDERDPYIERRDPYAERHGRYRDRDGRGLYLDRDDPYVDGRDLYLESRDRYIDVPALGRRDVYREGRGVEYRDTYRREEPLEHRDLPPSLGTRLEHRELPPSLGTRLHNDIGSDTYVPYRGQTTYPEPIYSAEYRSRAGLARRYHLG